MRLLSAVRLLLRQASPAKICTNTMSDCVDVAWPYGPVAAVIQKDLKSYSGSQESLGHEFNGRCECAARIGIHIEA
jgi:hypothetical protein